MRFFDVLSGKLKTRTWERQVAGQPLVTTYAYNTAGLLSTNDYSDTTADIGYTYDRQGRRSTIVQGAVTTTKSYNDAGRLLTESYAGGPLDGITVTNTYDTFLRRTRLESTLNSQLSTPGRR
jgi:hypothetical protein